MVSGEIEGKPNLCPGILEGDVRCAICETELVFTEKLKEQHDIQECFYCGHRVIICADCARFDDVVLCPCCDGGLKKVLRGSTS